MRFVVFVLGVVLSACFVGAPDRQAGQSCGEHTDCVSLSCQDGICCDSRCTDSCMACSSDLTGVSAGVCAPVTTGLDPKDDCPGGTVCNGTGGCTRDVGAACTSDTSCPDGYCRDGVCCSEPCNGVCYACSQSRTGQADGLCRLALAGTVREGECTGEAACDGTGACFAKQRLEACTADYECLSGACRDGICCNGPCSSVCESCSQRTTGVADGECEPIPDLQDPLNQCAGETACDGHSACYVRDIGTACGSAGVCTSGFCADGVCCDGSCDHVCMSCIASESSGADGTCSVTPRGGPDECVGVAVCDGEGSCTLEDEQVACTLANQCASEACCGGACRVGWKSIGPQVTSSTLRGLWAAAADDIVVVGDDGLVLRYDGNIWAPVDVAGLGSVDLAAVHGVGSTIVIVGDAGSVVRYDGSVWTVLPSPASVQLRAVAVLSANEFYVAGVSSIYRWANQAWTTIADSNDDWRDLWVGDLNVFAGSANGAFVSLRGTTIARYVWPGGRLGAPASVGVARGVHLGGTEHLLVTFNSSQRFLTRTDGGVHTDEQPAGTYVGVSTADAIRYAIESNGNVWRFDGIWASRPLAETAFIDVVSADGCTAFALLPTDVLKY